MWVIEANFLTYSANSYSFQIITSLVDDLLNPKKVKLILYYYTTLLFSLITFIIVDFNIFYYIYICIYIYIYSGFWHIFYCINCTTYLSIWDFRMHHKFWYIGSVLWKAWWWLSRVETCCNKNILCNKLLCLTETYTVYVEAIICYLLNCPLNMWNVTNFKYYLKFQFPPLIKHIACRISSTKISLLMFVSEISILPWESSETYCIFRWKN